MLRALTDTSVDIQLAGRWLINVVVYDDDGYLALETTPTITVTNPEGTVTNPTMEQLPNGSWRKSLNVDVAGRWIAVLEAPQHDAIGFAAYVTAVSGLDAFPTLAQVKSYLGTNSASDATIQDAMDAESAAQRRVCEVGAFYNADLAQALKRRVARNLSMRGLPIAVLRGDAESGSLLPPGRDPEVRRFEAPYRKLVQP